VVTDYLAEVDALGVSCWSADAYFFLSGRNDTEPELAEPIADFGELVVPQRLLACARAQTDHLAPGDPLYDRKLEHAIERYDQFLATFPGHELATQAEQERAAVAADLDDFHIEEESQDIRQDVESGRYCNTGAGAYLDAAPYDGDAADGVFVEGADDVMGALPSRLAADNVDEVV
jgi:hypothetical protein